MEDEDPLARLVAGYLARDGFEATVVGDGARAGKVARTLDPDVVVLDLRLPGLDRLAVCQALRGLAAGANDYLDQTFSPRELVARAPGREAHVDGTR